MEALANYLADILDRCIQSGMQMPFILCAASPNGSVPCVRFNQPGEAPDQLAEHFEPEGFRTPMSCMIVDQTGEAIRVNITAEGATFH
jgi:hypothetical protein